MYANYEKQIVKKQILYAQSLWSRLYMWCSSFLFGVKKVVLVLLGFLAPKHPQYELL